MRKTTIMLIMIGIVVAGSLSVWADTGNPFGFETNKHPLEYEYCKKEPGLYRGHGYKCSSAPRPHPDFQEYLLIFVEDVGICFIQAASNVFMAPADAQFEMFKGQIAKKYGSHHALSPLSPPINEYEERLNKAYPTLVEKKYTWDQETGFKGLGNVESIELFGDIFSEGRKIRVSVSFTFATSDTCRKKIDDKADRAF